MANPLKSMQRTREEYRSMDRLDRRRFWSDSILNNALYILMFVFVVYTAIKNKNFLAPGSIVNILSLVAASLPMALGIAGCIVLTGTDLSGGRVVGLTSAIAGALLQDRTISRKFFSSLPEITGGWILLTILCVVLIGAIIGEVQPASVHRHAGNAADHLRPDSDFLHAQRQQRPAGFRSVPGV